MIYCLPFVFKLKDLICDIRSRNINWQVVCGSQNIQRQNAIRRDEHVADVVENIGLKLPFSSWFSIHLLLHRLYRFYYQINSMRHYWIICLASICILLKILFIQQFFSLFIALTHFEKGISIQCFRRRPQQVSFRPLWRWMFLTVADLRKSQTMYIVNVPWS